MADNLLQLDLGQGQRKKLIPKKNSTSQQEQGQRKPRNVLSQQQKQALIKQYQSILTKPRQNAGINARQRVQLLLRKKRQQGYLIPKQQKLLNSILGRGKPSKQQIFTKFRGLQSIGFQPTQQDDITMQGIRQAIQQGYRLGVNSGLTPQQVYGELTKNKNGQIRKMYDKLKNYCGSAAARQKLQKAAYGKLRKQVSQKFKVPLHDADIILLLDDFVQVHPEHIQDLRQNRRIMERYARQIMELSPAFRSLSGFEITKFGGAIKSQDPYAIDVDYVKHVFGSNIPYPAPRKNNHYMYQLATTIQVPITTLTNGTALLTINPIAAFLSPTFYSNSSHVPFVNVASGNTQFPFAASPTYTASPFNNSMANVISFALDSLQIDFIETQSPINVKGKLTTAFFYQPPNVTWTVNNNTGLYNTTNMNITDNELTNDIGYVIRRSCLQCTKMTRLGTWIMDQDSDKVISVTNFGPAFIQQTNRAPFIFVKFTGATPSTNIGTAYIRVAASVQPTANMRGILKVTPRGSYQGVFRAFKQCRKLGFPLQFMSAQQAQFMFKDNYSQIDFQSPETNMTQFGAGQSFTPPLFSMQYDPKDDGFCVYQSLKFLGVQTERKPWIGKNQLPYGTFNIIQIVAQQIASVTIRSQSNLYLTLNHDTKHAYVLRSLSQMQNISNWISVGDKTQWVYLYDDRIDIHQDQFDSLEQYYPINIKNIPRTLVDKIIQQKIIVAPGVSIKQPLVSFDLKKYAGWRVLCKNGHFTVQQDKIFFTRRKTKQLIIVQNPSVVDVQTLTGQMVTLAGTFAQYSEDFYISNVYVSGQSLILNQSALQAFIKYALLTVQKNPGPGINPYKQFHRLKQPLKKCPRRYNVVKRNNQGQLQYYASSKKPTLLSDSDIEIQNQEQLLSKVQKRTMLNINEVKTKLGL